MKNKIIIVDNQDDFRNLMNTILTAEGYEVYSDATGDIVEKPFIETDLILIDIDMGKKDGRNLCRKLKQQSNTKQIPVILVSGLPGLPNMYHFCGANDFLKKPFAAADLISKVEQFLRAD